MKAEWGPQGCNEGVMELSLQLLRVLHVTCRNSSLSDEEQRLAGTLNWSSGVVE